MSHIYLTGINWTSLWINEKKKKKKKKKKNLSGGQVGS